jgi:hypothetical protein
MLTKKITFFYNPDIMLSNVIDKKKTKVGIIILLAKNNHIFLQLYLFYGNIYNNKIT